MRKPILAVPPAIIAIPAHDEAERVSGCLAALAMQRDRSGMPLRSGSFSVLLLANNCRDGTADVARAFDQLPRVTKAVAGVGLWAAGQSTLFDAATDADRDELRQLGVCAEVSGVFLDAGGRVVPTPLSERMIGIDARQMAAIPEVVVIAYGAAKAPAAHAATRGIDGPMNRGASPTTLITTVLRIACGAPDQRRCPSTHSYSRAIDSPRSILSAPGSTSQV